MVHQIDADIPNLRAVLKFRNNPNHCLVISGNKAKSDAVNLRAASSMLQGVSGEPARQMAAWLSARATEYEQCEGGDV